MLMLALSTLPPAQR